MQPVLVIAALTVLAVATKNCYNKCLNLQITLIILVLSKMLIKQDNLCKLFRNAKTISLAINCRLPTTSRMTNFLL